MIPEMDNRPVRVQEKAARSAPDRRTRRTKAALQQALRSLIFEKSYDEITVDDITAKADVGRSTFYLHFKGKDDLFRWSFECPHEELLSELAEARRHDGNGLSFLGPLLRHVDGHRPVYRALAGTRARSIVAVQMRRLLLDLCAQSARERAAKDGLSHDLVARALSGFLEALIMGWVETASVSPIEAVEEFAFQFASRDLGGSVKAR